MSLSSRLPRLLPAFPPPSSLTVVLLLLCLSLLSGPGTAIDLKTTVECHVRSFHYQVTKPSVEDPVTGEIIHCTGMVTVNSCWGRCDSYEIADYQMPYKISHHPVCTYTGFVHKTVTLSDCDGYPDPTVEVFDALGCHCKACEPTYTNCERLLR